LEKYQYENSETSSALVQVRS
jgi:progesterone-induced-blocking factor 1